MFSGGIEIEQWAKMGQSPWMLYYYISYLVDWEDERLGTKFHVK